MRVRKGPKNQERNRHLPRARCTTLGVAVADVAAVVADVAAVVADVVVTDDGGVADVASMVDEAVVADFAVVMADGVVADAAVVATRASVSPRRTVADNVRVVDDDDDGGGDMNRTDRSRDNGDRSSGPDGRWGPDMVTEDADSYGVDEDEVDSPNVDGNDVE